MHMLRRLFPLLAIVLALPAADWPIAGASRRWALEREAAAPPAPVGRVLVWPQAEDEATAIVTGPGGRVVPSRLVWAAHGEAMEVWFDATSAGDAPVLWVGKALAMPTWEPPAGLLLEVRTRPKAPFDTAEQITALWDKAAPVQGRGFARQIFHGANPFGPSTELAARFTGSFTIPTPGLWHFATISDEGSVLAVDGKLVVAWPGSHGPEGGLRGEHAGKVRLEAGRHRIDYLVVQTGGGFTAEVAWRRDGDKAWAVMPETAFAGTAAWQAVRPETAQGPDLAAIRWQVEAHAAPGTEDTDPCAVLTRFEVVGPPGVALWIFDDGGRDSGRLLRHWWLSHGQRQVTVEVKPERGASVKRTLPVAVHPAWIQPGPLPDERPHAWRKELANRDLVRAPASEVAAAVAFALASGETTVLLNVAGQVRARARDLAGADAAVAEAMAMRLQSAELRRYREAAEILQAIGEVGRPALAAARGRLHLGGLRLHVEGDLAGAAAAWQGLDPAAFGAGDRRLLALYRADALLLSGDETAARAAYRAVGTVVDPADRGYVMRRRLRLELARDRLSQGAWDAAEAALRAVEWETPLERLGDETGLLLMRLWLARGELERARVRGRMLLSCADGARTSDVLLAAIRVELAGKDRAAAARLAVRLRQDHPFSEAAAAARELLPETKP